MRYALKVLISIDRFFNLLTGGDLGVTYSTRSYINYRRRPNSKFWQLNIEVVDAIMFEKNHCKKSHKWEVRMKQKWVNDNTLEEADNV